VRAFDSRGRYLKRSASRRGGITLSRLSDAFRDVYADKAYITKKVEAAAKRTGVHADVIRVALGHRVVPPKHTARDRRIAKRIAANWVGSKVDVMTRVMDAVYKESPLLVLLPKRVPTTTHTGTMAFASGGDR
jgi:hypothetical protein